MELTGDSRPKSSETTPLSSSQSSPQRVGFWGLSTEKHLTVAYMPLMMGSSPPPSDTPLHR